MSKWNILSVFVIILALSLALWQWQVRRINKVIEEAGEVIRDARELSAMASTNETVWQQASAALIKGDYEEASRLCSDASSFYYEFQPQPDTEIRPGLKIGDWFQSQKNAFASNVVAGFDRVVTIAIASPERSHVLVDYYARYHHEIPELDKLYETRKLEVTAARLKAAGRWFRVIFTPNEPDLVQPIKAAIESAWDKKYGRTLVWGDVIDAGEEEATWMILNINLAFQGVSYVVQNRDKEMINKQVPQTLGVSFTIRRRDKVVSTWDNLQNMTLSEAVPETIVGPKHWMYSRVCEVAGQYRRKLLAQLSDKLKALPRFELFPGLDPSQVTLLKEGVVDHEAALVLACLAPGKLEKEAAAATWILKQPPQRTELVKAAVEHSITSLVSWVTGVINVETEDARKRIRESLSKNPSYGSFGPLLAMVSRAAAGDKVSLLKECMGCLFEPRVMSAVVELVNQPSQPSRGELVRLLLTECPHRMLASYTWLSADRDEEVANMAAAIISRRNSKLRWKMMAEYFDKWTPAAKSSMLFNLHYNPHEHGPDAFAVFKKAASQDQDAQVRKEALRILMFETAETPEGWGILDEVGKAETDPDMAAKIKEALAKTVARAHPEKAAAYMLKTVLDGTPDQRSAAAGNYFRTTGDVDARLKAIVPVLGKYAEEKGFLHALLGGLKDQGMSHIKDCSVPEFKTLISMALASKDYMARYVGIQLCNRAWFKGQTQYETILADFMLTETNSWLLGQAKTYYEPLKEGKK